MRKPYILLLACLSVLTGWAQLPSARSLFQHMASSIDTVHTISYRLHYRNINTGLDDSLFWSDSRTWARRNPADTVIGAHFHISQQNKHGKADYYYDGHYALDFLHGTAVREPAVTVITPYALGNGFNSVQSRTTARGFCEELLAKNLPPRWARYLDSMKVQDAGDAWRVRWTQTDPAENHTAGLELMLSKKDGLIRSITQNALWNGVSLRQETLITDLALNRPEDAAAIPFNGHLSGYKLKYDQPRSRQAKGEAAASRVGQKLEGFRYPDVEGRLTSLLPPEGSFYLLDFWETWCGYCFLAMPKLKAFHEKYRAQGFSVLGITLENPKGVAKVARSQSFPYPTLLADEKLKTALALEGRPRYILIDSRGNILADASGSLEPVEQAVEKLLGKQ